MKKCRISTQMETSHLSRNRYAKFRVDLKYDIEQTFIIIFSPTAFENKIFYSKIPRFCPSCNKSANTSRIDLH